MINLLPDTYKSEIRAARANVILVRYIAILAVALAVLGGIITAAYIALENRKASAQVLLEASNARTAKYNATRVKADALRASISSAKSILDQKISYSKLIYKIADSLPEGVVLEGLDLDPSTFDTTMTINVQAKTVESVSQLESRFATNSDVFSNVKLVSFDSGSTGDSGGSYPAKASVSFTINKAALQ